MPEQATSPSTVPALSRLQSALVHPDTREPLSFAQYNTPSGGIGVCYGVDASWVITDQRQGKSYRYASDGTPVGESCPEIVQALIPLNFVSGTPAGN